jgi:hypothetical protein
MSRKFIVLIIALGITILLVWLLFPSDEARIRKLVKESVGAVEMEAIDGVMGHIAFGYQDEFGQSYIILKKNLMRQFETYSDIKVEYDELAVEVTKDGATASMLVLVLATVNGQRGYILGDLKDTTRLVLELTKNPAKKWLITKAEIETTSQSPVTLP